MPRQAFAKPTLTDSPLYNGLSLTTVVSRLRQIDRNESFAYEELDAYHAPSECAHLIAVSCDRDRRRVFDAAGLTPDQVGDLIAARTSARWAYFYGPNIGG